MASAWVLPPGEGLSELIALETHPQSRRPQAPSFADHGNVNSGCGANEKAPDQPGLCETSFLRAGYSAGDGFFRNRATRLSHSSILAPWRFMIRPCCKID